MEKPILKSFLRIYEGKDICEASFLDMSGANFSLRGKNVISGEVSEEPQEAIRATEFIDLEVFPFEFDESLRIYDGAWALVYIKRYDRKRYPQSAKKPFNKAKLEAFGVLQGQLVYADVYQILQLHRSITYSLLEQHQKMQNTIVDLLNNPQSPLLRTDMNRKQVIASMMVMLGSALKAPR